MRIKKADGLQDTTVLFLQKEGVAPETLAAREELGTTGIGMGVAIPHVKLKGLRSAVCSLSIHSDGLDWQAVDGAPVQILFTVLRPDQAGDEHDPERHLEMMNWIARLAREGDFRSFAIRSKTKTDLVNLLKEMSVV